MKLIRRIKTALFGNDADVPGAVVFLLNLAVLAGTIWLLVLIEDVRRLAVQP